MSTPPVLPIQAGVPSTLRHYIDWQAMARDAEMSGDLFSITTAWDVVHVFAG